MWAISLIPRPVQNASNWYGNEANRIQPSTRALSCDNKRKWTRVRDYARQNSSSHRGHHQAFFTRSKWWKVAWRDGMTRRHGSPTLSQAVSCSCTECLSVLVECFCTHITVCTSPPCQLASCSLQPTPLEGHGFSLSSAAIPPGIAGS